MDEKKIANCMVCTIVLMTTIIFSWTFININQVANNNYNTPVLSALGT